jgi:hypothetical protein
MNQRRIVYMVESKRGDCDWFVHTSFAWRTRKSAECEASAMRNDYLWNCCKIRVVRYAPEVSSKRVSTPHPMRCEQTVAESVLNGPGAKGKRAKGSK